MKKAIDNFSINEALWCSIQNQLVSFRLPNMQKDVHYSISFSEKSCDINFHITRNIGNPNNKPKIEICRICKKDLEELLPQIPHAILYYLLEPVNIKPFGRRKNKYHYGLLFCSLNFDNTKRTILEKSLIDGFRPIIETKKNRLKIKGDMKNCVKNFAENETSQEIIQHGLSWLPITPTCQTISGIVISKKIMRTIVGIKDRWYFIRKNVSLTDVFEALGMDPVLISQLKDKTKIALEIVSNATTFEETREYNNDSIRLGIIRT